MGAFAARMFHPRIEIPFPSGKTVAPASRTAVNVRHGQNPLLVIDHLSCNGHHLLHRRTCAIFQQIFAVNKVRNAVHAIRAAAATECGTSSSSFHLQAGKCPSLSDRHRCSGKLDTHKLQTDGNSRSLSAACFHRAPACLSRRLTGAPVTRRALNACTTRVCHNVRYQSL